MRAKPNKNLIGREHELNIIQKARTSDRAELGVVYGRRRVGKSTLLQHCSKRKGDLYFEGLQDAGTPQQIEHFMEQFSVQTGLPQMVARTWKEAFRILSGMIAKGRRFVVFDELPWMAAGRKQLVSLIKFFWDNEWKKNPQLVLVLCGSVASFMVKHVVHSKALHNRKTFEIALPPLSACEAQGFFKCKRSNFELLKFLMVFGGIPKYLEQIDSKKSLFSNIDELCFQRNSFFVNEFETLFKEQFKSLQHYTNIVKTLAHEKLSKEELAQKTGLASGGGLTEYVGNLEQAHFVRSFSPRTAGTARSRTNRLYLWDEFLLFYFSYIEPHLDLIRQNTQPGLFEKIAAQNFDNYCGLAFERLCLKNIVSIISALGLGLHQVKHFGPFFRQKQRSRTDDEGIQIDILLERYGQVLVIIECKFSSQPTGATVIRDVERKIKYLKVPKSYSVEKVLIAPGGVTNDLQQSGFFNAILGAEALLK